MLILHIIDQLIKKIKIGIAYELDQDWYKKPRDNN
jgi:hypothetical protein